MHIEVDESGRVENLTQDSVLAFSNKIFYSVFLNRREKRKCLQVLRQHYGHLKNWFLKIFAALLFLLIKDFIDKIDNIVIDVEYSGRDSDVKGMLLRHIRKIEPSFPKDKIAFRNIGKKSKAHLIAYGIYKKKAKSSKIIKAEDILPLL